MAKFLSLLGYEKTNEVQEKYVVGIFYRIVNNPLALVLAPELYILSRDQSNDKTQAARRYQ